MPEKLNMALRRGLAGLLLMLALVAGEARAEVRMTFWSHDTSTYFPHAFFTLKGTVDSTGEVVDTSYGFTLNSMNPAALFASVKGHIDVTAKTYIRVSDAQFTLTINDAQYAAVKALVAEWGAPTSRWNLQRRNCVHFVAEAARRAGLTVIEDKKLMKKPRSFTRSLIPLNAARVTEINLDGKAYWAAHPEAEVFGVPDKIGGSVLGRRVKGLPDDRER